MQKSQTKRLRNNNAKIFALAVLLLSSCKSSNKNNETNAREAMFQKCLGLIDQDMQIRTQNLETAYAKTDPQYFHQISPENKSYLLRGNLDGGAVLLLHGILSSPDALRKLAIEFNKLGMTVLAPLITGFGATVKVANAGSVEAWQNSVDYHALSLSKCFSNFSLIGFSLGGALATDFTLNRYTEYQDKNKVARLNSLLLLSPAIQPAESFVPLKANITLLFADSVPFWLISKIKNDPDIVEMMKEPKKYNQYFPVYVGKNLHTLSKILKESKRRFDLHPLPVSLDYSQSDSATDWEETRGFLTDSFFDVRVFSYPKEKKVPHTLHLKDDNEIGNEIRKGVARFVLHYNKD
ncbi:MAG: alpha/beta hydrolase [Bdellovibrionota bacterium]